MSEEKLIKKRWFLAVLLIISSAVFTLFATALKMYTFNNAIFVPDYWPTYFHILEEVFLWILLAFIIYKISVKFPFNEKQWKTSLIFNLIASFVIAGLHCYLNNLVSMLITYIESGKAFSNLGGIFKTYYRYNILIYWIMLIFFLAFDYYKKYRKREREALELELKTSKLESQLTKSQLQALKMQLQPHFLFNTLHTISGLINEDVYMAKKTIALLSDLLRISLDMTDRQEIRLKEELEFVNKYLEIQKTRFKDRLNIEMKIEPETLDAAVPTLILQPLTENAISHGISPHKREGLLKIVSEKIDSNLILEIHDSGDGIKSADKVNNSKGIGLTNTKKRLEQLYNGKYTFELNSSSLGGLEVRINIPFKKLEENGS